LITYHPKTRGVWIFRGLQEMPLVPISKFPSQNLVVLLDFTNVLGVAMDLDFYQGISRKMFASLLDVRASLMYRQD